MAANKKPRKAYKPKRVVKDLLGYMSKLPADTVRNDILEYHLSLECILTGRGTIKDCDLITGALNACAVLCLQHDWPEYYELAVKGQQAQTSMNNRVRAGKSILYTGPEMAAVKDALALYQIQAPLMTPMDMVNASVLVGQQLVRRNFAKPL